MKTEMWYMNIRVKVFYGEAKKMQEDGQEYKSKDPKIDLGQDEGQGREFECDPSGPFRVILNKSIHNSRSITKIKLYEMNEWPV